MKDHLGIFGHPEDNTGELNVDELRAALAQNAAGSTGPPAADNRLAVSADRRRRRASDQHRQRRKLRSSVLAVLVLAVIAAGIVYLVHTWSTRQPPPAADFAGSGTTETIVKISTGDGLNNIASALVDARVVASAGAFVQIAQGNEGMQAIQPGYYKVREGASADSAVTALLTASNRVGMVDLIPGLPLADYTVVRTGERLAGYVSQITAAACVPLNGASNCFTADDLWRAIRTSDLAALGLVDWAVTRVTENPDLDRRLEGMLAPGVYNIPPGGDPVAVLKTLLNTSAVHWSTSAISANSHIIGHDPYETAIIASLIEREAITADMPNVSRVLENRLALGMRLQLDSTVNYAAGESQIATNEADRNDTTSPYNTYAHTGLPPTPIGGIGPAALDAALHPADGPWVYFVKVDPTSGKSCFSTTLDEHNRCVAQARANGVFG